jgi:hypothetical protein
MSSLTIADDVDHMLKSPIGCWHAHDFFSSQWKDPFMHRGQCEVCHAKHHRQSIFDILFMTGYFPGCLVAVKYFVILE